MINYPRFVLQSKLKNDECVWVCVGSAEEEIRNVKGKERKKREREGNAGM